MKFRNSILLLTMLALVALNGCARRGGKSSEARVLEHNRLLARRYFDEVWNQGKLDALDELLDKSYLNHTPSSGDPPPRARRT